MVKKRTNKFSIRNAAMFATALALGMSYTNYNNDNVVNKADTNRINTIDTFDTDNSTDKDKDNR